ncbi:MAG TPA: hypothetical protein VFY95_03695 [Sphingomicrobium sp.]
MVTMMDEIFDRAYQDGRADLNAGLDRAFTRFGHAIDNAFQVLQRIEYNEPWAPRSRRARARARAH